MTHGAAPGADAPQLSVVLACDGALDALPDRLAMIARACRGRQAHVHVTHSTGDVVRLEAPPPIATSFHAVPSRLVPVLWGVGMASAQAPIVALTTTQFRVRESWARELIEPFREPDVAGSGGTMALPDGASTLTRAVFLIRYAEHMASPAAAPPADIAGDNAAYRREAVLEVCPDVARGFWEVDVHRLLRARGHRIAHAPRAVAEFAPELSVAGMLANRLEHGSHFGAYRVNALRWPRWRAVAVTPLVPFVLLRRILARMKRAGQPLRADHAITLVPSMLALLFAWAAGEARGAMTAAPVSRGR